MSAGKRLAELTVDDHEQVLRDPAGTFEYVVDVDVVSGVDHQLVQLSFELWPVLDLLAEALGDLVFGTVEILHDVVAGELSATERGAHEADHLTRDLVDVVNHDPKTHQLIDIERGCLARLGDVARSDQQVGFGGIGQAREWLEPHVANPECLAGHEVDDLLPFGGDLFAFVAFVDLAVVDDHTDVLD